MTGAGLEGHLLVTRFGPSLDRLENQATRLNEWFLGPGAASVMPGQACVRCIALHRKTVTLERELKAAEAALADDPTEENFNAAQ